MFNVLQLEKKDITITNLLLAKMMILTLMLYKVLNYGLVCFLRFDP